jgi:hypothetical protein
VQVEFNDCSEWSGFTTGFPAAMAALTVIIRSGRSPKSKPDLLKSLWQMLQIATGAGEDHIVIGIQKLPASQAMEMGKIMPDVEVTQ